MIFAHLTTTTALLFVVCGVLSSVNGLTITTAEQLITFSNDVNKGTSYSGTTVYLDSDIDFNSSLSQQFQSIGNTTTKYFNGTFDGKGYTISNLALSSSLQYVGLFGYSRGATIKNVVMDSSCSIKSSCTSNSDSGCLAGSIIGECRYCVIENVVNMANVTLSGRVNANLVLLGGIAGRILGSNTIRNCVNYGTVSLPEGFNVDDCELGGIVGIGGGGSASNHFIHNCANYGNIESNGTASILIIGGIIGNSWEGTNSIENCVSAGKISTNASSDLIGAVVGYNNATATIAHCLWTNDVGYNKDCGYNNSIVTVSGSSLKELDNETVNGLNEYASKNSTFNNWFMLHLNEGRINNLTQEALIVTQKHFPDPVKGGSTFLFWCLDGKFTERYDPQTTDITGVTDLYAGWSINMVTFNFRNGTNTTKIAIYGKSYGTLPSGERTGHTFAGWFTEENGQGERITEGTTVSTGSDHTLYAQWTINNYTITFVFDNGAENEVRVLNYNETIVYPEDPTKEGYTFIGWSPRPLRMPAENIIVTAQWIEISSSESGSSSIAISSSVSISSSLSEKSSESISSEEKESSESSSSTENATGFVEIVFGKKDLKEEEVKDFIREYVAVNSFAIMKIENDEKMGGTRVIVKFDDADAAKSFVEVIRASSDKDLKIIRVGFVDESVLSFSGTFYLSLLNLIFVI